MRYVLALLIWIPAAVALAVPDEIYVDPAINANSGTGTSGDPYGDLQYALNNINHGGDGCRINVKAGTAEVVTSTPLSLTTYQGTNTAPGATDPLIIEGYTSTAGDGGIGEIQGTTNNLAVWGGTDSQDVDYMTWKNMKLTGNQASGYAVTVDNQCVFLNVELISNHGGIDIDQGNIDHCKISYVDSGGVLGAFGEVVATNNYFVQTSGAMVSAAAGCNPIIGNVFNVRSATDANVGLVAPTGSIGNVIANNTFLANLSSGTFSANAIRAFSTSAIIANNYIEGFNSANDEAIDVSSASVSTILANNAFFNNTANINDDGLNTITIGSTSSLSASGVTNAASADFTPTADLKGTGYPTGFLQLSGNATDPDIGAIETTGGGNTIDPLTGTIPGL